MSEQINNLKNVTVELETKLKQNEAQWQSQLDSKTQEVQNALNQLKDCESNNVSLVEQHKACKE